MSRAPKGVGWASALSTVAVVALFLSIAVPGVGPSGISPVLFGGVAIVVVAALVLALLVAAIWGRPTAQATFHVVVSVGLLGLAGVRMGKKPSLGIEYVLSGEGAIVTNAASESITGVGLRAPFVIDQLDGHKIGLGQADPADLVARRRPFDQVTLRAWSADVSPRLFKVLVGD